MKTWFMCYWLHPVIILQAYEQLHKKKLKIVELDEAVKKLVINVKSYSYYCTSISDSE
jgi:hypothetical protein